MAHIGVAGVVRTDGTEELDVLLREEAAQREHRIERGRRVTLGQDEAVAVGIQPVGRIDVHHAEIQSGQRVDDGQAAADMAGGGGVHRVKRQKPCLGRTKGKLFFQFFHKNQILSIHLFCAKLYLCRSLRRSYWTMQNSL